MQGEIVLAGRMSSFSIHCCLTTMLVLMVLPRLTLSVRRAPLDKGSEGRTGLRPPGVVSGLLVLAIESDKRASFQCYVLLGV